MNLNEIVEAIRAKRVRITDHADEEAAADHLTFDEIYFSVIGGEIIEEYPADRPYPSCLIYGQTFRAIPFTAFGPITQKPNGQLLSPCTDLIRSDGLNGE